MLIFHSKEEARQWVREQSASGRSSGLVPTMGALHEGHYSLVRRSRESCDATVATIFVNPTQFGPNEDLNRYPRTLEEDLEGLRKCGADAVFVPAADSMYVPGHSTYVDPPDVAATLEGSCRPGHFRGVATVVLKLMHILPTTHAFFGQKDYQQVAVIQTMVRDLDLAVEIHLSPTVRDADGLAMSSRNRYLSPEDRVRALSLSRALNEARRRINAGETDRAAIEASMRRVLMEAPVDEIDYVAVADPMTLARLSRVVRPAVALVAARVGNTRLIDNQIIADH